MESLTASLRLDVSGFTGALTSANQAFQQFANAVSTHTQASNSRLASMVAQTQQATQAMNAQAQSAGGLASVLRGVAGSFGTAGQAALAFGTGVGVATAAVNLIVTGITAAIGALRDYMAMAVQTAAQNQQLSITFKAIEGSATGANETLKFLWEQGNRLGLSFGSLAGNFRSLEAATRGTALQGEKTREIFVNFAEAAKGVGLSSDQFRHVLVAVEQMISKGTLSAEELRRQLGNYLPGAFRLAAESIGITTERLEKMLRQGMIPVDAFILKFSRTVRDAFSGELKSATETLISEFARFKNEAEAWANAIGNVVLPVVNSLLKTLTAISGEIRYLLNVKPPGVSATPELKTTQDILKAVEVHSLGQKLDPRLVTAVIQAESGFNPLARSKAGAVGLMQIMPDTARALGYTPEEMQDPGKNLEAGTRYLRQLLDRFQGHPDAIRLALAGYNAGPNRGILNTGQSFDAIRSFLPAETQAYVPKVMGFYERTAGQLPGGPLKVDASNLPREGGSLNEILGKRVQDALKAIQHAGEEASQKLKDVGLDFGASLGDPLKNELDATSQSLEKIHAILTESPTLFKNLPEEARQGIRAAIDRVQELQKQVDQPEQARQRIAVFREMVQQEERFRAEQIRDEEHAQDTILALRKRVEEQTLADQITYDEAILKARKSYEEKQQDIEENISRTVAKETKSRVDDLKVKLDQELDHIKAKGATAEQIQRKEMANVLAIQRAQTEELSKEVAKQEEAWRSLGEKLENVLGSAFEKILSGSKNIFEGIKDAFIKLLARLAAEAAAAQIVIGIKSVIGQGGLGGGAQGGTFGNALGALAGTIFGQGNLSSLAGQGGGSGGTSVGDLAGQLGQQGLSYLGKQGVSALGGEALSNLGSQVLFTYGGTSAEALVAAGATGAEAGALSASTGATAFTLGTASSVLSGIGTGIATGFILKGINDVIGLTGAIGNRGSSALAGAGGGAAAGALVGSVVPVIGTGIGAAIGAIVGAIGGAIFGGGSSKKIPRAQFDIQEIGVPGVTYSPEKGLGLSGSFYNSVTRYPGFNDEEFKKINDAIFNQINEAYGSAVSQFQQAQPQIQAALQGILTGYIANLEESVETLNVKGTKAGVAKDLDTFVQQTLPGILKNTLQRLGDAVVKINPLVQGFNEVISNAKQIMDQLKQEQARIHLSLQESIHSLEEALYTPAQLYVRRREELSQAREFFAQANPQQRLAAIPLLQSLATEIFSLGKGEDVLGQDPQLVRDVQTEMIGLLKDLQGSSNSVFDDLRNGVQEQIDTATAQIDLLTGSLQNLDSIDSVVAASKEILGQTEAALNRYANQDEVNTVVQSALLAGQLNTLLSIDTTGKSQLEVLAAISARGLGGGSAGGSSQSGEGYAGGSGYIPYNMVAYLHQGEAVVPRHQTGSRGASITINVSGVGDPDRVANEVVARIERQALLGKTRLAIRR